jgi:hypothetical protein
MDAPVAGADRFQIKEAGEFDGDLPPRCGQGATFLARDAQTVRTVSPTAGGLVVLIRDARGAGPTAPKMITSERLIPEHK